MSNIGGHRWDRPIPKKLTKAIPACVEGHHQVSCSIMQEEVTHHGRSDSSEQASRLRDVACQLSSTRSSLCR